MVAVMCLPTIKESSASGTRSILGMGALMLVACLAGPAVVGAIGALGVGVLVGTGGAIAALALCAAIPALAVAARRRSKPAAVETADVGDR
jgi:hypothetical protein